MGVAHGLQTLDADGRPRSKQTAEQYRRRTSDKESEFNVLLKVSDRISTH